MSDWKAKTPAPPLVYEVLRETQGQCLLEAVRLKGKGLDLEARAKEMARRCRFFLAVCDYQYRIGFDGLAVPVAGQKDIRRLRSVTMSEKVQDQDVAQPNFTSEDQTPEALQAEEIEAVIAPKLAANHNETVLE